MLRQQLGGLVLVLTMSACDLTPATAQQPMVLVAADVAVDWTWHVARVWTAPRAPGQAGETDRVAWRPATGELLVIIRGHPSRSGDEGQYPAAGDCVMRLARPDLAGATLTVQPGAELDGPSVLVFTRPGAAPWSGTVQVSAGCDTTGA
jgi:hypothetical protein